MSQQNNYIVYKHTSPTGKIYIGLTKYNIEKRAGHNGSNYRICPYFYHAIKKHGWNNFTHDVVSSNLSKKEAIWLEKYLIAYYHSCEEEFGYNLTTGGDGTAGMTDAVRKKLSESHKGVKMSQERVAKMAAWHRGKKRSTIAKKNISDATKRLYQTPEGKAMASKRAWNKRKVTNGEETYQSVKETAEAIGIKPDTLRKAIYDGRPMRGYHWRYVA